MLQLCDELDLGKKKKNCQFLILIEGFKLRVVLNWELMMQKLFYRITIHVHYVHDVEVTLVFGFNFNTYQ